MGATAAQKLIAFFSFTVVASMTGREVIGTYFYAISITSIFVTFADLGMTPVVIRAVAGGREEGARLLGAALRAKLVMAPLAALAAMAYAVLFGADSTILLTVAIACLVMTADTVHLVLYGVLRGKQNLKPEAMGMFIGQILTATVAILAAWFKTGPVGLAIALLIASVWNVGWSLLQLKRTDVEAHVPLRSDYRLLMREALPFGIAGIAVKVYSYVDTLFIKMFHGVGAVGTYAVAYKLTYALQFLPLTFTAALYPALSSAYANKEEDQLRNTFIGSLRLMAAFGFAITASLSALAPRLIPMLYGKEFIDSIPSLSVLPWVLLPIFLDFPIGSLLNATRRAHLKTTAMVATMVINIILNLILVPLYGPVGAAWAGVGSFWLLYLIGVGFTASVAGGWGRMMWLTARALFAAAVSWIAWRSIGERMDFLAASVFGGAVAVSMAFIVQFITVDDVYRFIKRFRPAPQKVEEIHD